MGRLMRVGLDANIFIYVLEKHPDYFHQALALLTAVESGLVFGQASELTYLEVLAKSSMTAQDILIATEFLLTTNTSIASINYQILLKAAGLRLSIGLKTPDAIHVASASVNNCNYFITNDDGLIKKNEIDGVKIISLLDFKL